MLTGCRLGAILVPTWCHHGHYHEQFMSTYSIIHSQKNQVKLSYEVNFLLYSMRLVSDIDCTIPSNVFTFYIIIIHDKLQLGLLYIRCLLFLKSHSQQLLICPQHLDRRFLFHLVRASLGTRLSYPIE